VAVNEARVTAASAWPTFNKVITAIRIEIVQFLFMVTYFLKSLTSGGTPIQHKCPVGANPCGCPYLAIRLGKDKPCPYVTRMPEWNSLSSS
jgi:hypothetical protein